MAKDNTTTIIIKENTKYGVWGVITGFVGIFVFSIVLSPLAFILGVIGLLKGQIFSSGFAIIFALLGLITSPIIMGFVGLGALLTIPELQNNFTVWTY